VVCAFQSVGTGATAITITPSADAIATVTHARQDADTARLPDDVASVIPSRVVDPGGTMLNIPRFYAIAS